MRGWVKLLAGLAKNIAKSMRQPRKIGERIPVGQNRKEKENKNREEFLVC
jgi:hypothetical protein